MFLGLAPATGSDLMIRFSLGLVKVDNKIMRLKNLT
jgi:hypothetical protein